MEVKQKTLERKVKAGKEAFNESEIQEAEADYKQAMQQIEVAKLDHRGDISKAEQQDAKVRQMKLFSPFDGIVEKINMWEGEFATPDREKYAILVVKNDPCDIDITTLWSWQVAKLSKGETMQVRYVGEKDWRDAKIIYIASVAKSESDNQIVRLEMPNPEHRATGLPVEVKLPAKLLENNGMSSNEQKTAFSK